MDGRIEGSVLSLDGDDWQLLHLVPREWESRQVWKEEWEVEGTFPGVTSWIRGSVPGDVVADSLDAGLIPDPYVDMNSRACEWLAQRDWVYRKEFTAPKLGEGEVLRLCFEGVDFACRIYLNGDLLGAHEGMFTPFEFDLTGKVRQGEKNRLVAVVMHAPSVDEVQGQVGRTSEARLWKSRFAYGWDWCTRLIPVGIWRSVTLMRTGPVWLKDVWARPLVDLSGGEDRPKAEVEICADLRARLLASDVALDVRVLDNAGVVASHSQEVTLAGPETRALLKVSIPQPKLWWANGMGEQPLYRVEVTVRAAGTPSDAQAVKCGLRTFRMIPNPGASEEALPYTMEINGRPAFIRGWNWVPLDHMYGRDQGEIAPARHPHADRYRRILELAAHAHCNLLRVWGGGLLESRKFYDLCDQLGIMVWQEFPLSSSGIDNRPPTDAAYLNYIEGEARQMVPLRRNHPSLAIWCGGNELMDEAMGPLTDAHPAIRRMKAVVQELDPDRSWFPTSASGIEWHSSLEQAGTGRMHDVHGPWQYQDEKHHEFYNTIDPLLHGEFGVDGAANLATIKRYISPDFRFPPNETNPAWVHHGSWWLHQPRIEKLFGPVDNLEDFVRASQWVQAEGLRYAIEAHRRRAPLCSGTIPWQFNEAFPNTSCTNAVDYLLQPKPAYWTIRQAYAPVSVSLKFDRLAWKPGEEWNSQVWAVGDQARNGVRWRVRLFAIDGRELGGFEGTGKMERGVPVRLEALKHKLPDTAGVVIAFAEVADLDGGVLSRNEYLFSTAEPPMRTLLQAPEVTLRVWREGDDLLVENEGDAPALMVSVTPVPLSYPENGYFCLPPKGRRTIVSGGQDEPWNVHAWNAENVGG